MADTSAEAVQQRIQIARRDAETMKDRIKKRKDELADTTRKYITGLFRLKFLIAIVVFTPARF